MTAPKPTRKARDRECPACGKLGGRHTLVCAVFKEEAMRQHENRRRA